METNPNKIAPCGVSVIVEIIRRNCLIVMSLSVCLSTNPVPVRSQIKLFSLTQRSESSAPFKVDRSECGQTVLGDNLSHNGCHAS